MPSSRPGSFDYAQDDNGGDFSRAYTKIRLFDQQVKLGAILNGRVVLDIGSSTGGFTQFALEKGAKKVIAVEIGSRQMVPELALDQRVKLYEKTDILNVVSENADEKLRSNKKVIQTPDCAVMDASFTGSQDILLHLRTSILRRSSEVVLLFKPQFEAYDHELNNGVIKNSKARRLIIKEFEQWLIKNGFKIEAKQDSGLAGSKGNVERFYLLRVI
ncbi:MAG: hypothetical protein H6799_01180 [Candidatus Nomurabacteria bacterium]|nr:MAG: hypothetical protein H6799_01180 [Candidatus Nomurabacteria bacterium]HRV76234.1 SAM-dependent methyltransferase [Candidatus Saccharimonadales bacterium]